MNCVYSSDASSNAPARHMPCGRNFAGTSYFCCPTEVTRNGQKEGVACSSNEKQCQIVATGEIFKSDRGSPNIWSWIIPIVCVASIIGCFYSMYTAVAGLLSSTCGQCSSNSRVLRCRTCNTHKVTTL